jgi:hypothetical protein
MTPVALRSNGFCRSTPGALAPIRVLPGPSSLNRPHPPHSQAHPDFTALRLIPDAFAVHTAPRRPSSGSTLSLPFLLDMPSSTTPNWRNSLPSVMSSVTSPCGKRSGASRSRFRRSPSTDRDHSGTSDRHEPGTLIGIVRNPQAAQELNRWSNAITLLIKAVLMP